jgi:hypothetical protein
MALWTVVGLLAEFILLCLTWSTIGNLVRYSPQSAVLKQFYGASNTSTYALFQTQEALCAVWFVLLLSFLGPLLWKEIALLRAEWKDQTSRKRMQKTTSSRKRKVSAKTVPEEEGLLTQITYQSKMKSNDSIFWPLIFLLCTWLKVRVGYNNDIEILMYIVNNSNLFLFFVPVRIVIDLTTYWLHVDCYG